MNTKDIEKAKNDLIQVCKDYSCDIKIPEVIDNIVDLLNNDLCRSDEELLPEYVREVTFRTTRLIVFFARLGEKVELIKHLERQLNDNLKQITL